MKMQTWHLIAAQTRAETNPLPGEPPRTVSGLRLHWRLRERRAAVVCCFALGLLIPVCAEAAGVQLSIGDAMVQEGNSGTTDLLFNVQREAGSDLTSSVVIPYTVAPSGANPATPGVDYIVPPANARLRIEAGQSTQTLHVPVIGDTLSEPNETLQVLIGKASAFPAPPANVGGPVLTVSHPESVAIGDFDGDGDFDLAVVSNGSNTVSILRNNGAGGYTLASTVTVRAGPEKIIAGDFDRDGDLDLAVVSGASNNVAILRNDGTGNFTVVGNLLVGNAPNAIFAADLDGDGDLDLAVLNGTDALVTILRNNGSGGFSNAGNFQSGARSGHPSAVVIADFDRDRFLDLAITDSSQGEVSILRGNGRLGFAAPVAFHTSSLGAGVNGAPVDLISRDFNGDGLPDIVTVERDYGGISFLRNTGGGNFADPVAVKTGSTASSVTAADFDGDGDLDLAVANYGDDNVSILRNNGAGSFARVATVVANDGPSAIRAADLDGDGRADLVVANFLSNNVTVRRGNGALGFPAGDEFPASGFAAAVNFSAGNSPRSVAAGDFDGDNDLDLAVANYGSDDVSILRGDGSGAFGLPTGFNVNLSPGSHPVAVIAADFGGDHRLDLATANLGDDSYSVLQGDGTGGFFLIGNNVTDDTPVAVATGDFDGDGDLDLAFANQDSNDVSILLNVGDGGFVNGSNVPVGDFPQSVATGDFNGDGFLDLVAANKNSNSVTVLLGNGHGGFGQRADFTVGNGPGSLPVSVAVGDFNGDGNLDLAVANSLSNNVTILRGNGAGSFSKQADLAVGSSPQFVTTADFDGDGRLDLAVANSASNNVSILRGKAGGAFAAAVNFATGSGPRSITTGDFDGDSDLDLAVATSSGVSVLLSQIAQPVTLVNGGAATGTILNDDTGDTTPDAFSFTPATNVPLNSTQTSNVITVSGLSNGISVPVTVAGGSYSIGCTATFVTAAGSIANGQNVCLRRTASSKPATTTLARLTIGGVSGSFTVTTASGATDITPDAFSFIDVSNVAPGSAQVSNAITVSGINAASPVTVSGGFYGVDGGPCTQTSGSVVAGNQVRVCHTAASAFSTATNTTLTIGASGGLSGVSDTFTSTTAASTAPGSVQLGAASYTVSENVGSLTITLTRTGSTAGAASVRLATSNGSALAGSDYSAVSTTVNWADGDGASKTVSIPILDDTVHENAESFKVNLSAATGATLGSPAQANVKINDND